ncbi:MAG: 50S ribosomal protein L29 [SAR324 cluster bacterium]|nr:50S ribosomal protein L29 [SAR324 cluster bacterium]
MAKAKVIDDLRGVSMIDLEKRITTFQEEYLRARCSHKTGQLANKSFLKKIRRDVARAKTIFKERGEKEAIVEPSTKSLPEAVEANKDNKI